MQRLPGERGLRAVVGDGDQDSAQSRHIGCMRLVQRLRHGQRMRATKTGLREIHFVAVLHRSHGTVG